MSDAAKIQRREHSEGRRITVCVTLFTVCVLLKISPDVHFLPCFLVKPNSLRKFAS